MKKRLFALLLGFLLVTNSTHALSPHFSFSDDDEVADWARDSVYELRDVVITGYKDNTFRPNQFITRQEVAVLLDRYGGLYLNSKMQEFFEKHAENIKTNTSENLCMDESRPGLVLYIQDQVGEPLVDVVIFSATEARSDHLTATPFDNNEEVDPGQYVGLYEDGGYHHLVIEKEGYSTHRETFVLEADYCHVLTQEHTITLFERE